MNDYYIEVEPVIVYPQCISLNKDQDCFECGLYKTNKCSSPRGLCVNKYINHNKGCPNYGKKPDCPPYAPMFDQVFDLSNKVYIIYSTYDLYSHVERMRQKHPMWTERQLYNVLYWQGTAKKLLKGHIYNFIKLFRQEGYYVTSSPEAMGVDVTATLKNVGIELEWPARKRVYKVAMAGIPLDDSYMSILK